MVSDRSFEGPGDRLLTDKLVWERTIKEMCLTVKKGGGRKTGRLVHLTTTVMCFPRTFPPVCYK